MMRHPLEILLPTRLKRMVALAVFAGCTLWVAWIMQRLVRGISPDIVALEFARTAENARSILQQWGVGGEGRMLAQIRLDNWFVPLYTTTIALLCLMIGMRLQSAPGRVMAWAAWAAGLFDLAENQLLVRIIDGDHALAPLAFICAAVKFFLIVACLLYILLSPFFSRSAFFARNLRP